MTIGKSLLYDFRSHIGLYLKYSAPFVRRRDGASRLQSDSICFLLTVRQHKRALFPVVNEDFPGFNDVVPPA